MQKFKVMRRTSKALNSCPSTIPWEIVKPHQTQALKNHSQTLERLNERGGLAPNELYAVLRDQYETTDEDTAIKFLLDEIEKFNASRQATP